MAGSNLELEVEYYFRRGFLVDDAEARKHDRLVELLTQARAFGLISGFKVLEHAEAFPTQDDERTSLDSLRDFAMRRKIGLGRRFGSNGNHFGWFPARALLIRRGGELGSVFPCELENGYVEPEQFLESLLKHEPWVLGGVLRRKRTKRHDRLVDYLATKPYVLEPALTTRGREVLVSSMSGESGAIDLLFLDSSNRFLIVEVKLKNEELDKAVGQLKRHARLFAETYHIEPARLRLAIACPDVPLARVREFAEIGIECFSAPADLSL